MQINITGQHLKITSSLKEYVEKKFEKLTRHFDHVINIHVVLTVEKLVHHAASQSNHAAYCHSFTQLKIGDRFSCLSENRFLSADQLQFICD